jgi:hypothetical protein
LLVEIPVFLAHGLELMADSARLPPLAISPNTAAMQPFVCSLAEQFKVGDFVVELVAVSMMDIVSGWNGSVVRLPHQHMLHADPSLDGIIDPSVTFSTDSPVAARSRAFRAAFTHGGSA